VSLGGGSLRGNLEKPGQEISQSRNATDIGSEGSKETIKPRGFQIPVDGQHAQSLASEDDRDVRENQPLRKPHVAQLSGFRRREFKQRCANWAA